MPTPPLASQPIPQILAHIHSLSTAQTRNATNTYFIEGIRQFVQASDANQHFEAILYSPILLKVPLAEMLLRRLAAAGVPRIKLTPEQFRSISHTERASGIAAILRQHWTPLRTADPARGTCHLVIEYLRSPGNLGTILRTAEASGVGNILFVGHYTDPFDPNVVRASMGGIFHLPLVRTSHQHLAHWARTHRVHLVGLSPHAARLYTQLPPLPRIALLLGEERQGLSPDLQNLTHTTIRLPMTGHADSLNVAAAAAVMMYEMLRRRGFTPSQTDTPGRQNQPLPQHLRGSVFPP